MISAGIIRLIEERLKVQVYNITAVGGGDINAVYSLETTGARYLLKVNSAVKFPGMFLREKEGLLALTATNTLRIPEVYLQEEVGNESILLMEWIDSQHPDAASMALLGKQLAHLHGHTADKFGWENDNYVGSLGQSNKRTDTWHAFFVSERLQPLVKLASDGRMLDNEDVAAFEKLYQRLPNLFEPEQSSLLHGDLWSGNFLISVDNQPCLIDPAVYYGHREMDIALTLLFGGFGPEFYTAYHQAYPLKDGWRQRLDLWNLYPLLVHVNLFGGGYVQQLRGNLAKALSL